MSTSTGKRIHRFLIPEASQAGQTIELNDETMHYASRVLRLLNHSEIHAWNGNGLIFPAVLHYLSKNKAQVVISKQALDPTYTELTRPLYIAQALPEGDKMDLILAKCTELGASGFLPIEANRCVVKLKKDRADKKYQHWRKLIASASIQSERLYLPKLFPTSSMTQFFEEVLSWQEEPDILLFTPKAQFSLVNWLTNQLSVSQTTRPIVIIVGPEGGFDQSEVELAQSKQANILRFSSRILRTETFSLVCMAQLILGLSLETDT